MGKINELMYGDQIKTLGQLRHILKDLDDHDQLCIETIDTETGDTEDLYPMYIDVIDGIRLSDDTIVREVRFCQMPNSAPDTRDKSELIHAVIKELMDDYYHGDETCWTELLEKLPWEVLKQSLPEDRWADFDSEDSRADLIEKIMRERYDDDDPKYDTKNRAYLESLSHDELECLDTRLNSK
jgi:hypothetical protein